MPHPLLVVPIVGPAASSVALKAAALASAQLDLTFRLTGDERAIHDALLDLPHDAERLAIDEDDDGDPLTAALRLVARTPDAALVCGGERTLLDAARATLTPLPGGNAPALAAIHPTLRHRGRHDDPFALILDIGASPGASGDDLVAFAHRGAAWARDIARTDLPTVALLASQVPDEHLPAALRAAHATLASTPDAPFQYLGLLAADRVLEGSADVVVCDALHGDLLVRTLHSFATCADQLLDRARARFQWRLGVSMLLGGIDRLRSLADWENYGGAPLLGYDRVIVTLPPEAGERAWANTFRLARRAHLRATTGPSPRDIEREREPDAP